MVYFYMLIGLPGSGKSRHALNIMPKTNSIIISSDAIRKEFYGDEAIQGNPGLIFEEMQRRTLKNLNANKSVIYDATNISRGNRTHLLNSLPKNCIKVAIVIWAKFDTCVKRDRNRDRTVGEQVIRRMLLKFQPPYYDEGWDKIEYILNDKPYSSRDYNDWLDCNHDNPHHNNTVKEHTEKVVFIANKSIHKEVLVPAAKLHDIGKKFVKCFQNAKGEKSEIAHYYNHQNVGSYFAIGLFETSDYCNKMKALIYWLINRHMDPFLHTNYYTKLSSDLRLILDAFHECDVKGA